MVLNGNQLQESLKIDLIIRLKIDFIPILKKKLFLKIKTNIK